MSRRLSTRGTAGTLRRLGPGSAVYRPRRAKRQPLCTILTGSGYLSSIGPNSAPVFDGDIAKALWLPRDSARQVCLGLIDMGHSAELVGVRQR